jgi:hypothetical protein
VSERGRSCRQRQAQSTSTWVDSAKCDSKSLMREQGAITSGRDARDALRAVRAWRLGRGFRPNERSRYRRLAPIELLQILRHLVHGLYGWDAAEGIVLVLYYGLDVAMPHSEATTGQVLARRAGQARRHGQPVSVATVRRYLRTAESGLARAMMSYSGPGASVPDGGGSAADTRVDDAAFTVLASTLPLPPRAWAPGYRGSVAGPVGWAVDRATR